MRNNIESVLHHAAEGEGGGLGVGEFFAADVESGEGGGAVGGVSEEVFLGFGEFLTVVFCRLHSAKLSSKLEVLLSLARQFAGFIFAEAEATAGHASALMARFSGVSARGIFTFGQGLVVMRITPAS